MLLLLLPYQKTVIWVLSSQTVLVFQNGHFDAIGRFPACKEFTQGKRGDAPEISARLQVNSRESELLGNMVHTDTGEHVYVICLHEGTG